MASSGGTHRFRAGWGSPGPKYYDSSINFHG